MNSNKVHLFTNNDEGNEKSEDVNSPMRENLLELLQEGMEQTAEEHLANEKDIIEFLHMFLLEPKCLTSSIKEKFDNISLIIKTEGLPHIDKTLLDIVKRRKNIQEMEKNIFEKEVNMKLQCLKAKVISLEKKISCLQQSIDSATDIIHDANKGLEDLDSQHTFMTMKLKEYNVVLEKLETDLQGMQVMDLEPEVILEKYKQYVNMTEQVVKLDAFLDQYNDLPPDLLQAKILLENTQKKYDDLNSVFSQYQGI